AATLSPGRRTGPHRSLPILSRGRTTGRGQVTLQQAPPTMQPGGLQSCNPVPAPETSARARLPPAPAPPAATPIRAGGRIRVRGPDPARAVLWTDRREERLRRAVGTGERPGSRHAVGARIRRRDRTARGLPVPDAAQPGRRVASDGAVAAQPAVREAAH